MDKIFLAICIGLWILFIGVILWIIFRSGQQSLTESLTTPSVVPQEQVNQQVLLERDEARPKLSNPNQPPYLVSNSITNAQPGTLKYLDYQYGFNELLFGTNLKDVPYFEMLGVSPYYVKYGRITTDALNLNGVRLSKSQYSFFKDELYQTDIYWGFPYRNMNSGLNNYLKTIYGIPTSHASDTQYFSDPFTKITYKKSEITRDVWEGQHVRLEFEETLWWEPPTSDNQSAPQRVSGFIRVTDKVRETRITEEVEKTKDQVSYPEYTPTN
jgi:hypothetical protein